MLSIYGSYIYLLLLMFILFLALTLKSAFEFVKNSLNNFSSLNFKGKYFNNNYLSYSNGGIFLVIGTEAAYKKNNPVVITTENKPEIPETSTKNPEKNLDIFEPFTENLPTGHDLSKLNTNKYSFEDFIKEISSNITDKLSSVSDTYSDYFKGGKFINSDYYKNYDYFNTFQTTD